MSVQLNCRVYCNRVRSGMKGWLSALQHLAVRLWKPHRCIIVPLGWKTLRRDHFHPFFAPYMAHGRFTLRLHNRAVPWLETHFLDSSLIRWWILISNQSDMEIAHRPRTEPGSFHDCGKRTKGFARRYHQFALMTGKNLVSSFFQQHVRNNTGKKIIAIRACQGVFFRKYIRLMVIAIDVEVTIEQVPTMEDKLIVMKNASI